ncbi:CRISPR system precrRNA processing endoribonuclease RAMP protein Cas6 [Thermosulfurimonas marina]|uniref:CRISPR system precrRNA processing endoribonuclease RAMP protein Cas6 n=1 Tax=Thermosulfurimonas marina TaxID=2047767 RepID=A0A6H1WUD7_9BACT|nr:CRISPR system precrRNA processing endoribonuclease RAMP protein Cas6 [Thermosulfurimonas marina]QJA06823.1 CRISPR system precrRNA processing endoribonuclease RAMP protein Cas6 [Thermosulfurimonas marina]
MIWIPISTFYIYFGAEGPDKLPRGLFSALRGAFGRALKRLSCVARRRKSCLGCPLAQGCAYGYLFETPRPPEADRLRKYPFVGHPFAFAPPFPYEKKNPLRLRMTLVGQALRFFPHVVLALEALGHAGLGRNRVPLRLLSVKEELTGRDLYREGEIQNPEPIPAPENLPLAPETLTLHFLTPTALRFSRRLVRPEALEFHILVRNLLRRASMLSYFHVGRPLEIDFKGLITQAEKISRGGQDLRWVRFKRRSARTGEVHPLEGFTGRVSFRGPLRPFLELLWLGTYIQVGRHTSFGFGHFKASAD